MIDVRLCFCLLAREVCLAGLRDHEGVAHLAQPRGHLVKGRELRQGAATMLKSVERCIERLQVEQSLLCSGVGVQRTSFPESM